MSKNRFFLKFQFFLFLTACHAQTVGPTGPIFFSKNSLQKDLQNQKKFESLAQLKRDEKNCQNLGIFEFYQNETTQKIYTNLCLQIGFLLR